MKLFVLYDNRAMTGCTDTASVYSTADTEKEAKEDSAYYPPGVWYEYDIQGSYLINEKMRPDINAVGQIGG